jgi:hypothetical protein
MHYLEYDIIDENKYISVLPKYEQLREENKKLNAALCKTHQKTVVILEEKQERLSYR